MLLRFVGVGLVSTALAAGVSSTGAAGVSSVAAGVSTAAAVSTGACE